MRKIFYITICLALSTLAFVSFQNQAVPDPACQKNRTLPPKPRNLYNVGIVNQTDNGVEKAFIPVLSTTKDGRIGIAKLANNDESHQSGISLFLLKPEIETGLFHRPAGLRPLSMVDSANLNSVVKTLSVDSIRTSIRDLKNDASLIIVPSNQLNHVTMCEASDKHPLYAPNGKADQYLFNVMAFESETVNASGNVITPLTLWNFEMRARIKNPKTADAFIENVVPTGKYGSTVFSSTALKSGLEPSMTADGKLLVVRTPLSYSYNPKPCSLTGWSQPKPILDARIDPQLKSGGVYKYGFLKYPFKDSMGNELTRITPGYPWIDSKGNNLFFLALGRTIGKNEDAKLNFACANGGTACHIEEDPGEFRGLSVMGLWTQGKAVLLDGMLNNTDYPASSISNLQKAIQLYNTPGFEKVRITGNRFNSSLRRNTSTGVAFANLSIVESLENKLNYNSVMRPTTPRDVVWKMSRGAYTDEVVFDELIDPHYLIFSEMVGAIENQALRLPEAKHIYYDGFQDGSAGCYYGEVRVQNAATSSLYPDSVPKYGKLKNSDEGRIEPVALGGIKGKGLYLTNNNGLIYDLIARRIGHGVVGYFSTFFDLRNNYGENWYNLLTTPSGADIQVYMDSNAILSKFRLKNESGTREFSFNTPLSRGKWFHLAIIESGDELSFTINGNERIFFAKASYNLALLGLRNVATSLEIGVPTESEKGFSGWIDDVRLITHANIYKSNPEMACNMAHGTLLKKLSGSERQVEVDNFNLTDGNPNAAPNVFCNTKYTFSEYVIPDSFLGLNPLEFKEFRQKYTMPESLIHNLARPDFLDNNFCLTCHVDPVSSDDPRPVSLTLDALVARTMSASEDPRRQPLQPHKNWNGLLPANYLKGFNSPAVLGPVAPQTECGGAYPSCNIDPYLYNSF